MAWQSPQKAIICRSVTFVGGVTLVVLIAGGPTTVGWHDVTPIEMAHTNIDFAAAPRLDCLEPTKFMKRPFGDATMFWSDDGKIVERADRTATFKVEDFSRRL